jgi:hypothetical protein
MHHAQRRLRSVAARTMVLAVLGVAACSAAPGPPADGGTGRITINGPDASATYAIECTQLNWLWTIQTLQKDPGFTAMVETGTATTPKVMTIRNLNGFSGGWAEGTSGSTQASIAGSTFTIDGTAHGAYADRPTKPADVQYRMEAHC